MVRRKPITEFGRVLEREWGLSCANHKRIISLEMEPIGRLRLWLMPLSQMAVDWMLRTRYGLHRRHIDTYLNEFVFRYNRRFYRHVSFETILGLASHHLPTSYRDIVGRDNPRKGVPTVRRQPRRRRTATGMRADRSRPEKRQPRHVLDLTPA